MSGQVQFTATTLQDLVVQLNAFASRIQSASLILRGVKLDTSGTVAPTSAPGAGDPNVCARTIAGVVTYYHWTGAAWVAF